VDQNGGGQFVSVQAAIDAVAENNRERVLILVRPGVYKERVTVPKTKPLVTLRGQVSPERTVLTFDNYANKRGPDGKALGTSGSASVYVYADDFVAENLTFKNTAFPRKVVGQALALYINGDRAVFRRCRFLGWQDTLYAGGVTSRQFFRDCAIEGDVDFIFGHSAAVFERCRIHSKGPGYVTAHARLAPDTPTGYVFRDCELTGATPPASVYLGRPWRPYARVVFINCRQGPHIRPEGWDNWRDPRNEKTAWFAEHNSSGPGANPAARVRWARQLSPAECEAFETRRFLAGSDGWNPSAGMAR
jgi:pectinesterase